MHLLVPRQCTSIDIKNYLELLVSLSILSFICNHRQKNFLQLEHDIERLVCL